MRQTIRNTLLISGTALFSAACTQMPGDGQNTAYNTGGYTATAPVTNNVPEAGPLSATNVATNAPAAVAAPVAAAPQAVPVATVPQVPVPVATNYNTVPAATNYNPAATTDSSPYDVYAAAATTTNATPSYAATAANTVTDYSQPQNNANTSYTSYGTGAANNNPAVTTYYPDNSGSSYDTYTNNSNPGSYNNTGNTGAAGSYNNAVATGGSAVQVFATGSQAKADRISQNMRSQGLPAVVDMVGGLYKVRVPYPDAGAARANLMRVRQASGEAGAFVTSR